MTRADAEAARKDQAEAQDLHQRLEAILPRLDAGARGAARGLLSSLRQLAYDDGERARRLELAAQSAADAPLARTSLPSDRRGSLGPAFGAFLGRGQGVGSGGGR